MQLRLHPERKCEYPPLQRAPLQWRDDENAKLKKSRCRSEACKRRPEMPPAFSRDCNGGRILV